MPRGRKKVTDRLYIQVGDKYCVMVDNYNIILAEIYHSPDGKVLPMGKAYCNTFTYAAECMKSLEISTEDITQYLKKVEGASVSYKMGKLITDMPEGWVSDPCLLTTQAKDKEEGDPPNEDHHRSQ